MKQYIFGHWHTSLAGLGAALTIIATGDPHAAGTWIKAIIALLGGFVAADATTKVPR